VITTSILIRFDTDLTIDDEDDVNLSSILRTVWLIKFLFVHLYFFFIYFFLMLISLAP